MSSGSSTQQMEAQLKTIADIYRMIGYDAVGVGSVDLQIPELYYRVIGEKGIPLVQIDNVPHKQCLPYIVKQVNGIKISIVSFGAVAFNQLEDPHLQREHYTAFREARENSDILILLDQANIATDEWLRSHAERLGYPDIVIGGRDRLPGKTPMSIGKTLVVPTSSLGNYIGQVDIEITGHEKKFNYTHVMIDTSIKEDEKVRGIVKDYLSYLEAIAAQVKSEDSVKQPMAAISFTTCQSCHMEQYRQWRDTPHAHSLEPLLKESKLTQDCLKCHSERYRRTNIVGNVEKSGGVECASCHSDVTPHRPGFNKLGRFEFTKNQCKSCHTSERSPGFDTDKAYELVKHTHK